MIKEFVLALVSALLAVTALAVPAHAQTDGTYGATSTGNISVSASVPSKVRISGLENVNFGSVDPASPVSDAQNVCVFSNTASGGYNITATGDGTGGAFTIVNGVLTPVAYSVEFVDSANQTTGSTLSTGTALTGLNSTATTQNCSGGETASLIVGITSAELQKMQSGLTYAGNLTLVVAPE